MTPEEIAMQVFDDWYKDAASFTGPSARRSCIAAIAAAIRADRQEMLAVLRLAQEDVCSLHCPSVFKTGEQVTHSERCSTVGGVVAKAEADTQIV